MASSRAIPNINIFEKTNINKELKALKGPSHGFAHAPETPDFKICSAGQERLKVSGVVALNLKSSLLRY